ncbi:MAG: hypothetical protein J5792_05780 [Bacteroidales bacterium]|nr:hypothetical protein [Bacteroidales bacterium]
MAALLLLVCGNVTAQKNKSFSGTIKYSIRYEGDFDPQQLANAPTENTETIMGNFTRTSINIGIGYQHQIDMVDSITILFDIPMEKMAYSVPASRIDESFKQVQIEINKREDTKTICGYVCQGYDIVFTRNAEEEDEDEEEVKKTVLLVYTTEDIGIDEKINHSSCPGLKGYPLYQEQQLDGNKKIITEAVEVKKKKVSEVEFMIPVNYNYYTPEAFKEHLRQLFGTSGSEDDEDDDI